MYRFFRTALGVMGLFCLLVIIGCEEEALPTVTVSGTVTGTNGPIEGATVFQSDNENVNALTDATGTYSINITEGSTITVKAQGFTTLTAEGNTAQSVDFALDIRDFPASFATSGNQVLDPVFLPGSIQPTADMGAVRDVSSDFFTDVDYKGAIDPDGTPWYAGWSFYDNIIAGNLRPDPLVIPSNIITVSDADMQAAGDEVYWTSDNLYLLDGFVFVNEGQTLYIEAGTVIYAKAGEASNASALIVARGGTLMALGTAEAPIIFTYEGDTGEFQASLRGQWGGLILLGSAGLNSAPGLSAIEGIPTGEARGLYGVGEGYAQDDDDSSGVLRYVSIRHGGTLIGGDNEINGLTLGGVGRGTTLEYIEVIGNRDDGIEWFGGTADAKYLIVAYCGDDGIDYDEGYRGNNQFVIVHQGPADADRCSEFDGGTDPETAMPYAIPTFSNMTFVGNPSTRAMTLRDNAGGKFYNSIFTNSNRGIDIENLPNSDSDAYQQWKDGNIVIENNVFFNIGAGDRNTDLFVISDVD